MRSCRWWCASPRACRPAIWSVCGGTWRGKRRPPGFWHDYADALVRQREGDRTAADAALKSIVEKYSYGGPFQIAILYALRKEPDRVFEWLGKAWEVRDSGMTQLFVTPFLIDYRDDPRFASVAAKLGVDAARGAGN